MCTAFPSPPQLSLTPPKLSTLLAYMHIPTLDRALISRHLHQQWITELLSLHHSFTSLVGAYETRHHLSTPPRGDNGNHLPVSIPLPLTQPR